jgi:hypothetical protein
MCNRSNSRKYGSPGAKLYEGDSLVCDDNNVFLQTGIVSAASTEKEYVVKIQSGIYSFVLK